MKRKSKSLKIHAVRDYHEGMKVKDICEKYHCPRSTFYSWIKPYSENKTKSGTAILKDLIDANRKIKKLEHIIEILQNSSIFKNLSTKEKELETDELFGKYSVHELCDAFLLSRATYYNHIMRAKNEKAWYLERRAMIAQKIREIFDSSHQTYGVKRIHAVLQKDGYRVSRNLISLLMRTMGIQSISTTSKSDYEKHIVARRINRLRRNFNVSKPNEVWVSDMTCFNLKDRRIYICVYIDLYSRKILACNLGSGPSTNLATRTIRKAIQAENPTRGLIIHTDNGSAYISYTMRRLAAHKGFTLSFSKPGQPHDNAVAEAFFSNLKKEFIYRNNFRSKAEFERNLGSYIEFYNNERIHGFSDKYNTPTQFELAPN